MIYTFENPEPEPDADFVSRLNIYAYEACRAGYRPRGWRECGRTEHAVRYRARVGSLDLYVNYDDIADIFVGHTWV